MTPKHTKGNNQERLLPLEKPSTVEEKTTVVNCVNHRPHSLCFKAKLLLLLLLFV